MDQKGTLRVVCSAPSFLWRQIPFSALSINIFPFIIQAIFLHFYTVFRLATSVKSTKPKQKSVLLWPPAKHAI